jgi:hypothetical protein
MNAPESGSSRENKANRENVPANKTDMKNTTGPKRPSGNPDKIKKWKNWWYYYKWYVICGIIVLGITLDILGDALGLWQKEPDFQVAYVGKSPLSEEDVHALEETFASIGDDFNGDGKVIVRINQYITDVPGADTDAAYHEYATEVSLIGDISDCESYFFLTDDAVNLQRKFQILANADGTCPDDADYSTDGKVIAWADCPLLRGTDADPAMAEADHGKNESAQVRGGNDKSTFFDGLFLGRRCFFNDNSTDYHEQCDALWDLIYGSHQGNQNNGQISE